MRLQPISSDPRPGVIDPDVVGLLRDVVVPWVREQGYDPDELTRHVELLTDGEVLLRRYVLDSLGRKQLDPDAPDDDPRALTEDVRVRPLSPFPFDSTDAALALLRARQPAGS